MKLNIMHTLQRDSWNIYDQIVRPLVTVIKHWNHSQEVPPGRLPSFTLPFLGFSDTLFARLLASTGACLLFLFGVEVALPDQVFLEDGLGAGLSVTVLPTVIRLSVRGCTTRADLIMFAADRHPIHLLDVALCVGGTERVGTLRTHGYGRFSALIAMMPRAVPFT